MIILGFILLIIGLIAKIAIIWTIGIIVVVLGAALALLGFAGHALGAWSITSECRRPRRRDPRRIFGPAGRRQARLRPAASSAENEENDHDGNNAVRDRVTPAGCRTASGSASPGRRSRTCRPSQSITRAGRPAAAAS